MFIQGDYRGKDVYPRSGPLAERRVFLLFPRLTSQHRLILWRIPIHFHVTRPDSEVLYYAVWRSTDLPGEFCEGQDFQFLAFHLFSFLTVIYIIRAKLRFVSSFLRFFTKIGRVPPREGKFIVGRAVSSWGAPSYHALPVRRSTLDRPKKRKERILSAIRHFPNSDDARRKAPGDSQGSEW